MKKRKKKQQAARTEPVRRDFEPVLLFGQPMPGKAAVVIGAAAALLAAAVAGVFLAVAWSRNGFWGFPLDDPWIHLCFSRNLAEFGSFSYFRDQLVTSGSTSPLYTLLLAFVYKMSQNEFIISYVLGILFFLLAALAFWMLARVYAYSGRIPQARAEAQKCLTLNPGFEAARLLLDDITRQLQEPR